MLAVASRAALLCGPHELGWTEIEALVNFSTQRIPYMERLVEQRRIYQNLMRSPAVTSQGLLCSTVIAVRAMKGTQSTLSGVWQKMCRAEASTV